MNKNNQVEDRGKAGDKPAKKGLIAFQDVTDMSQSFSTKDDVADTFKMLLDAIKDIKSGLDTEVDDFMTEFRKTYDGVVNDLRATVEKKLAEIQDDKTSFRKELDALGSSIASLPTPEIVDYEGVNERAVDVTMDRVLPLIPKIPSKLTKTWKAEIEEMIKDAIKRRPIIVPQGGSNYSNGKAVQFYDLSASLDGVTKTFSLPAFWRVISVNSSSAPFTFRKTTDYTTNGSTYQITFTSEIDAASALATGQTITILYVEN